MIPSDPVMLLSYVNTQLRDFYPSLTEFCEEQQISEEEIKGTNLYSMFLETTADIRNYHLTVVFATCL